MRYLIYVLLMFWSTVLTYSCKRDISNYTEARHNTVSNSSYKKGAKTFRDIFFQGELVATNPITDVSDDRSLIRYAVPFKSNGSVSIYKYQLFETNTTGKIVNTSFLISRAPLANGVNLFSLAMQKDTILFYEQTLYPNSRAKSGPVKAKLSVKTNGREFNSEADLSNAPLPCDSEMQPVSCMDWYWVVYNADTGEIISVTYLYTSCTGGCDGDGGTGGGGGSGDGIEPSSGAQPYICASSFNFKLQGTGSITNVSKTWGIIGALKTPQASYTTTFGVEAYAPTDVKYWGDAWSRINMYFYYLVQSGDIWLRPDAEGVVHLMFTARAHREIAAAATDYASLNYNNPQDVLSQPNGSSIYKARFAQLFSEYMKAYIPGSTAIVLNSFVSGCAQATYSSTPC